MTAISMDALSKLGLTGKTTASEQKDIEDKARDDKLGQADFLKMMTQQLKNQDPLNPMDNGAFLAQLAQISTVQGLSDLNKKADQFLGASNEEQALRGASLIGRQVEAPGSTLALGGDGSTVAASVQATGTGPVSVTIQDATGAPVRTLSLTDGAAGPRKLEWDGKNSAGARLPAGNYKMVATQAGADGQPVALDTFTGVKVESVSLGKDGVTLNLAGGQSVQLSQVQRIS